MSSTSALPLSSAPRLLPPPLLLLLLHLLFFFFCAAAAGGRGHGGMQLPVSDEEEGQLSQWWQNGTYTQRLDHFSFAPDRDAITFTQRYFLYTRHWLAVPGNTPPIIVYTGGEWDIDVNLGGNDFPIHVASRIGALVVYMEHRYYGQSFPFGSKNDAYNNGSTLAYLTSSQALADFAEITLHVRKRRCPRGASCPIIAMGCSYGGMLAAWFRLKYPHIVLGSLASSAPVLFPDGRTASRPGFFDVPSNTFKRVSWQCYLAIRGCWNEILAYEQRHGIQALNALMGICSHKLVSGWELRIFLHQKFLKDMAQNDSPWAPRPERFCRGINGTAPTILEMLAPAVKAYFTVGHNTCFNVTAANPLSIRLQPVTESGWSWQTCTEMIFPMGSHPPNTMFSSSYYDYNQVASQCNRTFGVFPRPDWIHTTFNISTPNLGEHASNIIFSNGLRDPWSAEGVTKNISATIVALTTQDGAHCTDMGRVLPQDPQWLNEQRRAEINIINQWLSNYIP